MQSANLRTAYFDDGTIQVSFPGTPDLESELIGNVEVFSNSPDQPGVVVRSTGEAVMRHRLVGWHIITTTRKDLEDWWHALIQKIDQTGLGTLTLPYPGGSVYEKMVILAAEIDQSRNRWFHYSITFEQAVPCTLEVIPVADHAALSNLTFATAGHTGFVSTATAQSISAVKTFTVFCILPSSNPTTDYQAAHKKYVDDLVANSIATIDGGTP
jgi:hypothetical protein